MLQHYILDGRTPVPASILGYAMWRATTNWKETCVVGKDYFNYKNEEEMIEVSTTFIGLDHDRNEAEHVPMIFETKVFGGPMDQLTERYATWEEAEEGHKKMVVEVKKKLEEEEKE